VTIWGSGRPRREFLRSDDLAEAVCHVLEQTDGIQLLNVGSGADISTMELAELVADIVGYRGRIETDTGEPDGTFRTLRDTSRLDSQTRVEIWDRRGLESLAIGGLTLVTLPGAPFRSSLGRPP
jgi:GDP-L-fucose synthase